MKQPRARPRRWVRLLLLAVLCGGVLVLRSAAAPGRRAASPTAADRLTLPPAPATANGTYGDWPAMCGAAVPERLQYTHKVKPGIGMPHTRELSPAGYLAALQRAANTTAGIAVALLPGSARGRRVMPGPIQWPAAEHDAYAPDGWPLGAQKRSGGGEAGKWAVRFDHSAGAVRAGDVQMAPPEPPLWAALAQQAYAHEGNTYTCRVVLGAGGCRWRQQPSFRRPRKRFRRAVVVCDEWCRGYFHFVHEHLPRIGIVADALSDPRLHVITYTTAPYVRQYLTDVLGVPAGRVWGGEPRRSPLSPKQVPSAAVDWAVHPMPQPCGGFFGNAAEQLRSAVFARLSLPHVAGAATGPFSVLWSGRKSRCPANWEAVRAAVEDAFGARVSSTVFDPGARVVEQIRAFNAADVVVGPHGANLANVMWMRRGADMVEIQPYSYGNMCYYTAASRLGVNFRFVLHGGRKSDTNYSVPEREVVWHVRDARSRR